MHDDTSDPSTLARIAQHKAIRRRRAAQRKSPPSMNQAGCQEAPQLSPSQQQGRRFEDLAKQYIETSGAQVLQQNLLCRAGEIDLICVDGGVLAFVEVRHRHSDRFGGAAASVDPIKQQRIARAAAYFLPRLVRTYFQGRTPPCRFDVIALEGVTLTWLKGAFSVK